jgi:hypothetical protein
MSSRPKPWGKITVILWISAAVMALFIWKYNDTKPASGEQLAHVHPILEPFYNIFGPKMWLVFGAVAAILFAAAGIKAVAGKPSFDDE